MDAASFIFILLCFAGVYGSSSNEEQRIINGTYATICNHPYMISLQMDEEHICGGGIINRKWIVTAAHCFYDENGKREHNYVRRTSLCSGTSFHEECNPRHEATKVKIHPRYNPSTQNYDIAVVQVKMIRFGDCTKPIRLPLSDAPNAKWGIVCGWGYYQKNSDGSVEKILSDQLQCTQVPLVKKCSKYFSKGNITPQMVCFGYLDGRTDTCQADSGGPLVNQAGVLHGVTSWGIGCAENDYPGVYTNIPKFVNWIKNNTGMNA